MSARLLAVDFDGVLHRYDSGWQGPASIIDPPTEGALPWLTSATERFDVCIFSTRNAFPEGVGAMRAWLLANGLPEATLARISFPTEKPPAFLTLDDRAIRFDGEWPDLDLLGRFAPWNKRRYPDGKATPDDQGELTLKVSTPSPGLVRIDFGKDVTWLGMNPKDAREFAQLLLRHAAKAEAAP